jgi:parvulin-like peptidyl-prolyl cis-trans isomerase-like protein/FtsX-like permease family protein
MRFRIELRSRWRGWLTLAIFAGIAGGVVVAAAAGARRTDSALARHLVAFRVADASVGVNAGSSSSWRTMDRRIRALPQVEASAVTAELSYCARDKKNRSVIDVGPQAVGFWVNIDGRNGIALNRPKLLAGRLPDQSRPGEALVDSRAAERFGVRPGDSILMRVFPSFDFAPRGGDLGVFRCDPQQNRYRSPYATPERRKVRHILLECGSSTTRDCDRAKVIANRLYARLEQGADFDRLARAYSDDPGSRAQGGKLWVTRGETVPQFDRTAFRLRTGTISQPEKTKFGYHIIQPLSEIVLVGRRIKVRVVGVRAATDAFPIGRVDLTPAFDRAYVFDSKYFAYLISVRLSRGAADIPAFRAIVDRIAGVEEVDREQDTAAKIQRSIHHQAQALRLAAALGALLALILLFQALVRTAAYAGLEHPTLRALGVTRYQLVAVGVARAAAIAVLAALLSAVLAFSLSPLTPIGLARELEPDTGFALDPLTVGLGATAVFVAVLLAGALAGSRASREPEAAAIPAAARGRAGAADALARWGLPATVVTGVRLALARGRGATAVPVGATLLGGMLAVGVVAIALTFSASLDHLLSTPRLYGQSWDYRSEYCCENVPAAKIGANPSIADAALGQDKAYVLLNGRQVGVVAMDAIKGRLAPIVTQGRAPEQSNEILLAAKTLDALGLGVGDTVDVRLRRRVLMRIVGRGVVPEGTFNELGKGAVMTFAAFKRLLPGAQPYAFQARIAPGADREATLAALERRFVTPAPGPPRSIADFGGVAELPLVLSALLVLLAAGALAHTLITAVHRRRRDLAILKTLGFDRRQVLATVAWQATTFAAVGLVVGLPLGIATGRWVWDLFANQIGVVPGPVTPIPLVLLVIPGAVLLANLVAAVPAQIAARTRPALVLRAE